MAGLFIQVLGIFVVHYWYALVGCMVPYALWRMIVIPVREHAAAQARDRLRHEHARQDIDRIALETTAAMYQAARNDPNVIDGAAEEWR